MSRTLRNPLDRARANRVLKILQTGAPIASPQPWCAIAGQAVSYSGDVVALDPSRHPHSIRRLDLISRSGTAFAIWSPPHADSPAAAPSLRWGFTVFAVDGALLALQRVVYVVSSSARIVSTDLGDFCQAPTTAVAAWNGTLQTFLDAHVAC